MAEIRKTMIIQETIEADGFGELTRPSCFAILAES